LKICFLTPEYPHPNTKPSGGIGTSIKNLAFYLSTNYGHSIKVLVTGQESDTSFFDNRVEVHTMKNITAMKGMSWFFTRKKIQSIINSWVEKKEVVIVESADWGALSASIRFSCPKVIRLNGTDTFFCHLENRPVKWFNRYLEQQALQNADTILAVSDFVGRYTQRLFNLRKPYHVVHNGLDISSFQPQHNPQKEAFTILYFGTLIRKKGALELPYIFNEVCRQLPHATLKLVGKDAGDVISGTKSTWAMMQQCFTEEALRKTQYMGSVPYADIRQHIAEAAVCIFPSYAECWPMSWMEAMAMEKAVVASNIGWASEMIADGEEGFLVHPANHIPFAQAIIALVDCGLRLQIGKAARAKVERYFSSEMIASQTLAYYKQLLERI
jgi:glycosyltransferase involved in cell wall biosynthesis